MTGVNRRGAGRPHEVQEVTGRGVALSAGALVGEIAFTFVIAALVKLLYPDVPIFAVLFCRYLFCLPLLFAFGVFRRGGDVLQVNDRAALAHRIVYGLLGLTTWFAAVALIDISLATALAQTMSIFITVLAAPILGEAVGWRRIGAVLAGFAGVLVLLGPVEVGGNLIGIACGLASPFFAALMFLYLRKLGPGESPVSTALWYNATGVVFTFLLGLADGSMEALFGGGLPAEAWLMLVAVGVLGSFQQFLMAASHVFAPASVLAPVHYAAIPMGVVTGIVFFGERITLSFIAGMAVILFANYVALARGHRRGPGFMNRYIRG